MAPSRLIDDLDETTGLPADADASVDLRFDVIEIGTAVEVRRRFDQAWAKGFIVAEVDRDGYHLRRNSDGAVLPVGFPRADLRRSGAG